MLGVESVHWVLYLLAPISLPQTVVEARRLFPPSLIKNSKISNKTVVHIVGGRWLPRGTNHPRTSYSKCVEVYRLTYLVPQVLVWFRSGSRMGC